METINEPIPNEDQDELTDYETCPHCGSDDLEFVDMTDQTMCIECGVIAEEYYD